MKCLIADWDNPQQQPVPESTKTDGGWEIEIDDIFTFTEKHNIRLQLIPPTFGCQIRADAQQWFIWISKRPKNEKPFSQG